MTSRRRVVCTELGDPSFLRVVEEPIPLPGPGEVLVESAAVGVSFVDSLIVRGAYQVRPSLPFTPGNTLSGTVLSAGRGVDPDMVGVRVAALAGGIGGTYASHVVVPAATAVPLPPTVSPMLAAGAMEGYLTVTFATTRRVSIATGEHVVVLGAAGGIGLAAVDVARSLGAHVIAVASTAPKRSAALGAGAHVAIGYDGLKDRIRQLTDGGADAVIDPVGGGATDEALRSLRPGGRLCVLGFASGAIPSVRTNIVLLRNRSIVGVDWGDWSRTASGAEGNAALLSGVLQGIAHGKLRPPAPSIVPLADAGKVLTLIGGRRAVGKYVLAP